MSIFGICQLCGKKAELQLSHVIPKFVYSWHRKNSESRLRTNNEPNKRIQDGEKHYLFCRDCEVLFSKWENEFSRTIFEEAHKPKMALAKPVSYGSWALKFAVSISYRVIVASEHVSKNDHCNKKNLAEIQKAKKHWKAFLLGHEYNPGRYEQHMLALDVVESHSMPNMSPFMNRYTMGTVHTDVVCGDNMSFTFAKLFRLIIIGHIVEDNKKWHQTKLHVKYGKFGGPLSYKVPDYLFLYMNDKANEILRLRKFLSEKQKDKIAESFKKNISSSKDVPIISGTIADYEHFGNHAFEDET